MAILNAVLLGLFAGLSMGLGAALVSILGTLEMRAYDCLLGFAAGVMTAVATLGLIVKALDLGNTPITLAGLAFGSAVLFVLDRFLPHEHHGLNFSCTNPAVYRRGLLIFAAMTLHNLPEGLAVGTSYIAQPRLGLLLAVAIALHNIPEGIAVAGPFRACGMPHYQCLAWATASGLVEPVAAFFGAVFVSLFSVLLPFSLAFAGGAMLYVVSDELIPESHSRGYEHEATLGFIVGFLLLLAILRVLD
ncbi:MAG: ZIP family metal transporter [Thermodesulfobacteriota bacterium]|nr:ZIP family metal transporter [Thermodesulfobacteriota bacterium]